MDKHEVQADFHQSLRNKHFFGLMPMQILWMHDSSGKQNYLQKTVLSKMTSVHSNGKLHWEIDNYKQHQASFFCFMFSFHIVNIRQHIR